jgi:hypothetical protein
MDKLSSRAISRMFAQPVDPQQDNLPHYATIVRQPMDLGTVRHKLLADKYPSVSAWRDDMELIWANSLSVNSRQSVLGSITLEMQSLFKRLSQNLTDNPDMDWLNALFGLREELNTISRAQVKKDGPKSGTIKMGEKVKHPKKQQLPKPPTPPPSPDTRV